MSYSVNLPQSLFDLRVLFSLGVFSAGVFIYIYYLKKEKLVSFFIGWFIIFLLPQSGLFPINAYFSEHFIYLSAMGIFVIFVYFLLKIKQRRITNLIFLIYAVFFSAATIKYNFVWQDEIEFYKRIIKLTKNSFTACNNLGVIYLDRKDYIKAEKLFIKSLEANPDFFEAKLNLARFYYFKNDYKRAIGLAEAVIKDNPNSYLGYNYLGVFYSKVGNFELAEDYFEKATEINPKYMGLWYDLHSFYKDRGNDQKANAVRDYIAKTDKFSLAELYYREAKTFSGANNFDEALAEVDNAIKIDLRNSDYFNLRGSILRKIGRYPQAYNDFKMAINISLRNYEAYNNLGNLFALAKDFKNAESNFRRAIKLNADFTDAYFNLGLLYLENNKTKEAAECFKKAIVLNSDHNLAKEYLKRIENPAK